MLALGKSPMLSGGGYFSWYVNDGLQISGGGPAAVTSPAIEEGVQDAEFFVSTDAGVGWRQFKHGHVRLDEPQQHHRDGADGDLPECRPGARLQPIHSSPGSHLGRTCRRFGPKQVYYKAGRLYLAQSTALAGNHDGIYWAEVKPQADDESGAQSSVGQRRGRDTGRLLRLR